MSFVYRAYCENGREESGLIDVADPRIAIRDLASRGRTVFELTPAGASMSPKRTRKLQNLTIGRPKGRFSSSRLFRDLAILTGADMTLSQALRALLAGEAVQAQRDTLETIATSMNSGRSAADSFALVDAIAPDALALIASGERTSQLAAVLKSLADQSMESERRRKDFIDALAYPAFLLVTMCVALGVVIFVLVPSLVPIFENAGQRPPSVVRILAAVHFWLTDWRLQLTVLLLLLGACAVLFSRRRRGEFRVVRKVVLALPLIGTAIHRSTCARYLRSLSLLIGGGTPMTEALTLAARASPSGDLRLKLEGVRDQVTAGARLPTSLAQTQQFDPKIVSLLAVGDEVNRLPFVLSRAASILDDEANEIMSRILAALTPTITIILGLTIGTLVVSVMSALLGINDLAAG